MLVAFSSGGISWLEVWTETVDLEISHFQSIFVCVFAAAFLSERIEFFHIYTYFSVTTSLTSGTKYCFGLTDRQLFGRYFSQFSLLFSQSSFRCIQMCWVPTFWGDWLTRLVKKFEGFSSPYAGLALCQFSWETWKK